MRRDILTSLLIIMFLNKTVAMELYADEGANVTFDLPSVAKCGNFKFLNPQLYPLMVIKNHSAAAIEEAYVKRTTVYVVNNKLVLTLNNVTPKDRGKYRIYTKTGDITTCSAIHHYLNVKAKQKEYLTAWTGWTECSPPCDATVHRTRERNCSIPQGCKELGHMFETDSCALEPSCSSWSQWSQWGGCSAICGEGHRTRNRTCPVLDTCYGDATQRETCNALPCNGNTTFWSPWGPWGPCNLTCGGGHRQRTRDAKFPDSEVVASFAGWRTEEEQCNTFKCETGRICLHNSQRGGEEQDCTQFANLIQCHDSTGSDEMGNYHRSRHNDRHCEGAIGAETSDNKSGSSVSLIVGIATAVLIIAVLIVVLLLTLKLWKKKINVVELVRSIRRSRRNNNSPIRTPEIPRKASQPNTYTGVRIKTPENDRKSKLFAKEKKRKNGTSEVANLQNNAIDSLSYEKRPKSGKVKTKKKSNDNSNKIIRISAPLKEPDTQEKPAVKVVYDTPRHSHCENEDIAKIIITHSSDTCETAVDMDDTYEIPMNPIWNENCHSEGTRTPDIIGGDSRPLTPSSIDVHSINSLIAPKQSFMGLSDSCNSSPSSPGYAFKYPSFVGLSSLYDTPRSSSSNLTEMIYDVPRNNEPVYENDTFRRDEDDFYESPKTSVVQR